MRDLSVLGVDLAKSIFQLHGADEEGRAVLRKKLSRGQLLGFVGKLVPCTVAMEVCGGAHHWGREFSKLGHKVKLISPQFVKPYVKSNKNDYQDAEAICEAATRPSMRFVAVKPVAKQDLQCLHRVRQRLIKNRTALVNEVRGFLLEYGIVIAKNIAQVRKHLSSILEERSNGLTEMVRTLLGELYEEFVRLDEKVGYYNKKLELIFKENEVCQRISKVEGVGPITATALYSMVSDPNTFKNGRQFAASLGLVPRQNSSGGKTVLLGISKRGDTYLRMLLIHGARAWLRVARYKQDRKSRWATQKLETRGHNKACVAIANKNARVIWALMARGTEYKPA